MNNEQIDLLYKTIEAQDKIINEQVLEIADLKHQITLMNEDMRTGLEIKKELEAEIKSLNDSNIWWQNRYNAVERDNRKLKEEKGKAIELTKIRIESCNACLSNDETSIISKHSLLRLEKQSYKELLEILGDKE